MSDTFYIKPSPGLMVRDPITGDPLPEEGAEKPKTQHWLRRLRDGDVVEARKPRAVASKPEKPLTVDKTEKTKE